MKDWNDEKSKNRYEDFFLRDHLNRLGLQSKSSHYYKVATYEEGNKLDEKLLAGLSFYEAGTAMSLANTHSGGYVFVTKPKNGGNVWIRKWGGSEKTINIKINPGGLGGESIMMTNDNGFIISTAGRTIIKTDSNLSYR